VVKAFFSRLLRRSWYSHSLIRSLTRSFFFIADPTPLSKSQLGNTLRGSAGHKNWRSVQDAAQELWVGRNTKMHEVRQYPCLTSTPTQLDSAADKASNAGRPRGVLRLKVGDGIAQPFNKR
jgi:hypothetical protein